MGSAEAVSFMVGQCGLPRGARSATEAEGYVLYAFLNTLPLRLRQFCLPHPQLTGATALAGNLRYADGAMSGSRQEFAERRFAHAWTPSRFDLTRAARLLQPGGWLALTTPNLVALSGRAQLLLGRSPHNVEFDAGPGTSGHIRYFTFGTLELLLRRAGLRPLGRWTNVTHFSVLGSSELVGRLRPSLGHTLISVAKKSDAHRPRP